MGNRSRPPRVAQHGRPLACVLGSIDLVRALHIGGVSCGVAAPRGNPARYSRAATRVIEPVDAAADPGTMVDRLLEFAATEREPPILFYDGDWDLLLVSRERDRLAASFRFVVADAAVVESVLDKGMLQELAERVELPVPPARVIRAGEPGARDLDLRYPLIVKPLIRDHRTWRPVARTKAVRVDSPSALERTASDLAARGLDAVAQEAIPGGEDRIESYHVYLDPAGVVVAEFTGRKLRTFPAEYGYTCALVITDQRDVRELGRDLVRRLGLIGVAKLDFKRAPDGRLWLIDVNPRFNLWHHPAAVAGVNLPLLVYCDLAGRPRPAATRAVAGVHWCSPRHDLQAARRSGLGVRRWLRFATHCDAISGFAVDDPFPLPRAVLDRARRRLTVAASKS
jgi:D-aspartate ligase